ncbi:MAG: clostripain-related cysteine peptidase [Eubacteriaceae bacterium]
MKKLIIICVFLFFVCTACTIEENKLADNNKKKYTFLIYMNGSDLETENNAGTSDLYEMMKVGSNENINIVIETGGTKNWKNHFIDSSQNQRWLVKKNNLKKLIDLGAKNMGQADTLSDFITWGIKEYPSEKYALILWNHGGGSISGFGYDEKYNYDTLLLLELENALKDAYEVTNTKFEIIGFDACLMSSLETADIVSPYTNYLVASTELEPSIGWEYTSFLKNISGEDMNGEDVGIEIANSFINDAKANDLNESVTLSVTDTRNIDEVKKNFELFVKDANEELYDLKVFNDISRSISKAEFYGGQSPGEGYSNMLDLGDMASNLSDEYKEIAKKITNSIEKAVVYQVKGKAKEQSTGLSIYFPYYNKENIVYEMPIYEMIGFSNIYSDFLNKFIEVESKDNDEIALIDEGITKNGNEYKIGINKNDIINVNKVGTVLGEKISENEVVLYGSMPTASFDKVDGSVRTKFYNKWITLNNNVVEVCTASINENIITYSIPAILNGEYCNIRVIWTDDGDGGAYKIVGAWHGVIPDNMVIRKEIIKIKKGDKIEPILTQYDIEKNEKKSILGPAFILEEEPEIIEKNIENDKYVLGFSISDCAQNCCYSEFTEINDISY